MGPPARLDRRTQALGELEGRLEVLPHPGLDSTRGAGEILGHPEPQALEVLGTRERDLPGVIEGGRVATIPTDHVAEEQGGVRHVPRERAGLIERGGERDHPVA